jgi:hypothetical protein
MISIPKLLGYIEIIDAADTYLVEGSQLPVYVTGELDMYVADGCATEHPCEHSIAELHEDGVVFKFITDGEISLRKTYPI